MGQSDHRDRADAAGRRCAFASVVVAISVPDELFLRVEALSRRLKVSRSAVFAAAAKEHLARRHVEDGLRWFLGLD
jgi:hypothetical protein